MKAKKLILFSLLTGLLLSPAWYSWGNGLILLIAFLPLLKVEKDLSKYKKSGKKVFLYSFLSFLTWNIITTWWIKNASFVGLLVALFLNSFLMTIPFCLFSFTKKRTGNLIGYISLILYWISFEYLYLNAEVSWTWLNLGNGLANNVRLIQWYEYTGTLGGTLWILLINILLFNILIKIRRSTKFKPGTLLSYITAAIIFIPISYSMIRFYTYKGKSEPYEILILQPNIDPYQKFNDIPPEQQMQRLVELADSLIRPQTEYVVVPETFITDNLWLDQMETHKGIIKLREFQSKYPRSKIVIGAVTLKMYKNPKERTATSRAADGFYYDSFNSALQIDSSDSIQVYHKSQLVVGVEKMPYPKTLSFLRPLTLRLGGTFRSHGIQDYRDTFISPSGNCRVAPVICYESIFGEYVTEYISKAGANFIFVITNDGWWGDTPGYVQHNSFSKIRAIETRRSIARSANTGISSFINQKGEIIKCLPWWYESGMIASLNASDKLTFYVKHGDYLGKIALVTGLILMLFVLLKEVISLPQFFSKKLQSFLINIL